MAAGRSGRQARQPSRASCSPKQYNQITEALSNSERLRSSVFQEQQDEELPMWPRADRYEREKEKQTPGWVF